jgi:branched-chain amino acid transport system substrate-binding protein
MRIFSFGRFRTPTVLLAAVLATAMVLIPSASASASTTYQPVSNYAQFVGGSGKANPKLSPVDIGVVNQQGGSSDIAPQWSIGATLAQDFINNQAGGINGHPVKLVQCEIPDQVANAAQCGEQMANTSGVQAISVGAVAIGNQALESAIQPTHKPIFFGVSLSPVDTIYPNGYILFGDGTHVEAPIATFAKQYLHTKSVSIVWPDLPGESVGVSIIIAALRYEGITNVHSVSYDPSITSLTTPFEVAQVGKTGLFIADAPGGPACSNMYQTLKQLNIHTTVLANVPCDSTQVAQADGGTLPRGWYYASANPLPGDKTDASLAAFAKVASTYGESQWAKDAWVADSFAQILTIAHLDNQVAHAGKALTAKNINAAAKAFHGPVPQGAPSLSCGSFKGAPAVCNDRVSFFQNTSPNVFTALARYLGPPAGFSIPAGLQ